MVDGGGECVPRRKTLLNCIICISIVYKGLVGSIFQQHVGLCSSAYVLYVCMYFENIYFYFILKSMMNSAPSDKKLVEIYSTSFNFFFINLNEHLYI